MVWRPSPRLPPTSPIERAVRYVIATEGATYREVAERFGVSRNSIRSRVEYRYGSLEIARTTWEEIEETRTTRRCIICRGTFEMEPRQHVCNSCRKDVEQAEKGLI